MHCPALSTEPAIPWVLLPYNHPGIVCLASSDSLSSSTVGLDNFADSGSGMGRARMASPSAARMKAWDTQRHNSPAALTRCCRQAKNDTCAPLAAQSAAAGLPFFSPQARQFSSTSGG